MSRAFRSQCSAQAAAALSFKSHRPVVNRSDPSAQVSDAWPSQPVYVVGISC